MIAYPGEIEAIWSLFQKLKELTGDDEIGANVGVITLYMDQVSGACSNEASYPVLVT